MYMMIGNDNQVKMVSCDLKSGWQVVKVKLTQQLKICASVSMFLLKPGMHMSGVHIWLCIWRG